MSRITNSNPPKRGEKLTSTELNQVFTEANAAFPMDGDNVRNEGVDHPAFSLSGTTGQSGIILHKADDDTDTGTTNVPANSSTVTPDPAVTVHTWSTGVVLFNEDQVIRVYWQFENQITGAVSTPVQAGYNALGWAVWLEWHSSSTQYEFPPDRTGYGCWWYKADQNYTIYGLRLRCRGLIINKYDASVENTWLLLGNASAPANHDITIGASNMAYMIMEEI